MEHEEFEEGRDAFRHGDLSSDNPYEPGTVEAKVWDRGYEYQSTISFGA